jgi:hypothetical protein
MGSRLPNATLVSKFQHGGKVPTFEPQETLKIYLWFTFIEVGSCLFYAKHTFSELVLRVGSSFLLDPTLSAQVPSLTSKKCCHVGIHVILETQALEPRVKW